MWCRFVAVLLNVTLIPFPPDLQIFYVQWLVDVTQKMNHPLQRLLSLNDRDIGRRDARCVISDGRDNAAFLGAVALIVDVAGGGRVVQRVDVVKGRREGAFGGVAVGIGPGGYVGKVGVRGIVQEGFGEGSGLVGDEGLRDEGDGIVAERSPCN